MKYVCIISWAAHGLVINWHWLVTCSLLFITWKIMFSCVCWLLSAIFLSDTCLFMFIVMPWSHFWGMKIFCSHFIFSIWFWLQTNTLHHRFTTCTWKLSLCTSFLTCHIAHAYCDLLKYKNLALYFHYQHLAVSCSTNLLHYLLTHAPSGPVIVQNKVSQQHQSIHYFIIYDLQDCRNHVLCGLCQLLTLSGNPYLDLHYVIQYPIFSLNFLAEAGPFHLSELVHVDYYLQRCENTCCPRNT